MLFNFYFGNFLILDVILWKKWKKLAPSSINKSVKSQKQCLIPKSIAAVAESVCVKSAININSPLFSTIKHFGDIIEANFA